MFVEIDRHVVFVESFYIGKTKFNDVDLVGEKYITYDDNNMARVGKVRGGQFFEIDFQKYKKHITYIALENFISESEVWDKKIHSIQSEKEEVLFIVHKNGVITKEDKIEELYDALKEKVKAK